MDAILFLIFLYFFCSFLQDKALSNGYHNDSPLEENHILSQLEKNTIYYVNRKAGYVYSSNKRYRIDPYTGSVYDEETGFEQELNHRGLLCNKF